MEWRRDGCTPSLLQTSVDLNDKRLLRKGLLRNQDAAAARAEEVRRARGRSGSACEGRSWSLP
jgi:hypothetical protein